LSQLTILSGPLNRAGGAIHPTGRFELRIECGDFADEAAETAHLQKEGKEIDRLANDIKAKRTRLGDEDFRNKAPAEIVHRMEARLTMQKEEILKRRERNPNWQATATYHDGRWVAIIRGMPGSKFQGNFYLYDEDWVPQHPLEALQGGGMQAYSAAQIQAMFTSGEISLLRGTIPK
jgi:hypothetical protein